MQTLQKNRSFKFCWHLFGAAAIISLSTFPSCKTRRVTTVIKEIRRDSIIPGKEIFTTIPCPEFINSLPADGRPVVLSEDKKAGLQIRGRVDTTDKLRHRLILETMVADQMIRDAKVLVSERREKAVICDCSKHIRNARLEERKLARAELISWGLDLLPVILIGFGLFLYFRYKKNGGDKN